jgi:hypothetical protein
MAIRRDNDELIKVLETHSVEGYPVHDAIFGDAFIIEQSGTGPVRRYEESAMTQGASPQVTYKVRPARPFSFEEYAKMRRLSDKPMDFKEWIAKYKRRHTEEFAVLPMTMSLREDLERGTPVSEMEAEYSLVKNWDGIGPDDTVKFRSAWAHEVTIPAEKLKPGMVVEAQAPPDFFSAGRIVGRGKNKDVVLFEVFTPVSYFSATDALANEEIKPGFYSNNTYSIGYGTRQTMEDNGIPLPPGKFLDEKEREYILNDLLDIKFIDELCRKHQSDEPHCLLQSLIFYVMPLHTKGRYAATFRPLPEKFITADFVISYDHE